MTAPAAPSSSIKTAPKTPDAARRHYVLLAWRLRAALAAARAAATDPEDLQDLAERLADAKQLAARARAWRSRVAARAVPEPPRPISAARGRARRVRAVPPPPTARQATIQVEERTVPNPYVRGQFITVPFNRRVDLLANELSAERIDDAQFRVGRMIQAVYEKASGARLGSRGFEPSPSRDRTIARELAVIYALEDATRVTRFTERLERAVGSVGARFLRAILTEGHTFASYAAARGKTGERGVSQVGAHFRFLLEGLTEAQHTAHGARTAPAQDEYRRQADQLSERLARLRDAAAETNGDALEAVMDLESA